MTYDGTEYEIAFKVTEDGQGTLMVETFVNGESRGTVQGAAAANAAPVQLVFDNSYDAGSTVVGGSAETAIRADKILHNDEIADYAGEFHFNVTGENDALVAEGTNDASGNITFDAITYTTENLNAAVTADGSETVGKASVDRAGDADVYTFHYVVSEETPDADSGVSYNGGTFGVTVTVTDNRAGKLTAAVAYDNGGDKLTFENTYGADAQYPLTLTGNKVIAAEEGLTPPALTGGEYSFTITGSEGAPMPEKTVVSNQGATVDFGPITYTMENVFGAEDAAETEEQKSADENDPAAQDDAAVMTEEENTQTETAVKDTAGRTKVFIYTISESGAIPGVTNEKGTKTVEVTVTDMGGGELKAEVTDVSAGTQTGSDFTFTNTYSVTPEESTPTGDGVTGGVTITKVLDGRNLTEGEFTFQMKDSDGNVVSEGTNDAGGNVELGAVRFTEPGTYSYTISEAANGLGGVTYDPSVYAAVATVVDNSNGSLSVSWAVSAAADGEALENVTFTNHYSAMATSVSLGAVKRLNGRALEAGEFVFELRDENGNVISTAKNDENGAIRFEDLIFDRAGTYRYTVSETTGTNATITYDDTVYTVTITVTDDGKGNLTAAVDSNGQDIVFTNLYTEPVPMNTPAAKTGDVAPVVPVAAVSLAALAVIILAGAVRVRRRRK